MTEKSVTSPEKTYVRFDIFQRIGHALLILSFTTLGVTGLIQKFIDSPISLFILRLLGGIESTRQIHHIAAIVLMAVGIYHVLDVLYRVLVLRVKLSMAPWIDDFKHLLEDVAYYVGLRKHRAYYGRYSYVEKMEYFALVWGTVVMAITGFMMWNPISTTRLLPGEAIPAAKAAHGGEAILAVLAIILWHFYSVHIKHLNKSMFTGKMTREEMEHEHPAELAEIESSVPQPIPPQVLRRRQIIYFPVALVITGVLSFGLVQFLTIENTALTTIPRAETAEVFVPITPTPRPTPTVTPTLDPNRPVGADTWDGKYTALFRNRCGACHGVTKVGGLTLATYADALKGGKTGPAIAPNNPDTSVLVQIQSQGGHPGQLTPEELQAVIAWIRAGAPEK